MSVPPLEGMLVDGKEYIRTVSFHLEMIVRRLSPASSSAKPR
jgi:hypothetical protein